MRELTERQRKIMAIASVAIFLLFSLVIFWFIGKPLIKFVSEPEHFREWVDGKGILGRLAFIGMVVLQVFIAIIPGEPLEIGAGYAFGALEGTLLCLLGTTLGSVLVFSFVRRFGVRAVEVFFPREKINSLRFLQNSKKLNFLVFIIFLIPGTPKDILSYCVGLTTMKMGTWLLISSIARIPSIITSTIGGNALGMGEHLFAIIVFAVTIVLSVGGLLLYNKICRSERKRMGRIHKQTI